MSIDIYTNYGTCDSCGRTEIIYVIYIGKDGYLDETDLCKNCTMDLCKRIEEKES